MTEFERFSLADLLAGYAPGSFPPPWTWDDEERDILVRTCCCRSHLCSEPSIGDEGHYQLQLEQSIVSSGIPGAVLLGDDGRVWDGHHRVVAARRLGLTEILVVFAEES